MRLASSPAARRNDWCDTALLTALVRPMHVHTEPNLQLLLHSPFTILVCLNQLRSRCFEEEEK